MKHEHVAGRSSRRLAALATLVAAVFAVGGGAVVVFGQRNSVQPQPQASTLPPVGPARPSRATAVARPAATMPTVPAGFPVSLYAETPAPRLMVYAPNGDLFVSSPADNSITVFRDTNNDGVFEQRSTFVKA